jgi:uncharacterized protein YkwD
VSDLALGLERFPKGCGGGDNPSVLAELFLMSGLLTSLPETVTMASLPRAQDRPGDARALLHDLNAVRATRGLVPLTLDPRLCGLAREHALDMVAHRFFGHASSDGSTPFQRMHRIGYEYRVAGENLVLDVDEVAAHQMLWRSNPHRENMLEPKFARVGIAAMATDKGELFVEDFSD